MIRGLHGEIYPTEIWRVWGDCVDFKAEVIFNSNNNWKHKIQVAGEKD